MGNIRVPFRGLFWDLIGASEGKKNKKYEANEKCIKQFEKKDLNILSTGFSSGGHFGQLLFF